MTPKLALRISAAIGFLAVALGAFGAHGLTPRLIANDTLEIWQTAVLYHFLHGIMLYVIARGAFRRGPWLCFLAGIVVFSGSLYLLALTNVRWLGAITPIGGIAFLGGWFWLAVAPGDLGNS
jgi:uncharacterized membrane protein YgdD (TMEM256/DUF423 family)